MLLAQNTTSKAIARPTSSCPYGKGENAVIRGVKVHARIHWNLIQFASTKPEAASLGPIHFAVFVDPPAVSIDPIPVNVHQLWRLLPKTCKHPMNVIAK